MGVVSGLECSNGRPGPTNALVGTRLARHEGAALMLMGLNPENVVLEVEHGKRVWFTPHAQGRSGAGGQLEKAHLDAIFLVAVNCC